MVEPSGFLPFNEPPGAGDKLPISPVYICTADILERGLLTRPSFYRRVILVDAYTGASKLLEQEKIVLCREADISSFEITCLPAKILPEAAARMAENAQVPEDFSGWRRITRNRRVTVSLRDISLAWRVYVVRGTEVVDTFSGERAPAASLLSSLFS